MLAAKVLDTTLEDTCLEVAEIERLIGIGQRPAMEVRWTRVALETSRLVSCAAKDERTHWSRWQNTKEHPPCLNTTKWAGEKLYLSDCPHTNKDKLL
jgi:hypothetical protein